MEGLRKSKRLTKGFDVIGEKFYLLNSFCNFKFKNWEKLGYLAAPSLIFDTSYLPLELDLGLRLEIGLGFINKDGMS
jgi:hypothetical protein